MKNTPKIKALAMEWIESKTLYCMTDCCDSMREAELLESKFSGLVNDEIEIVDYVRQNLKKEYMKTVKDNFDTYVSSDEEISKIDFPCKLPIPYESH